MQSRLSPGLRASLRGIVTSGGPTFVAMMQASYLGKRNDLSFTRTRHRSRLRGRLYSLLMILS